MSAACRGGSTSCWSRTLASAWGCCAPSSSIAPDRSPASGSPPSSSNHLFGLLFLYNNLHVAHHLRPTIPWYELPRFYRENRAKLLKHNNNFVYSGYWVIARDYLFKPVFVPVHPTA